MHAALRLLNLVAVVILALAVGKGALVAEGEPAERVGGWIGVLLVALAPTLTYLGLRRHASPGLRKTAQRVCVTVAIFFLIGGLRAAMTGRMAPALIGTAVLCLFCGLNVWGLRVIAREESDEDPAGGFLRRYWRGEFPLAQTFWAGGILVLVAQFMLMGVLGALTAEVSLRLGAWLVLSIFALTSLLMLVQGVSIWRSAERSVRAGQSAWALLARLGVVVGAAAFAFFGWQLLWRPLKDHAAIALGRDSLAPLEASVTTDGSVLLLHGTFGSGSADRVRALLAQTASIRTVALSSPGGRLREAAEIAGLVREHELDTYVDTRCESACTFVFLAGQDRAATPNARIGFHRPSFAGVTPLGFDPATEGMLDTYRAAGIPQDFLDRVAATEPSHMWYPTPQQLEKAGVINRISLGGETSALGYLAMGTKQDLERAFRSVPMMVAMDRHFPGTVDAAVRAAWMERTQGGIDSAVGNAARSVISERYPLMLAAADDASLDLFANIMVEQMKAARSISTEACKLLLAGQLNIAQVLSPELVKREQDWALGVLQAEALVEREPVDPADFQRTLADATAALPQDVLDVISAPENYQQEPRRQCDATIALYDRIGELPPDQRHLVLRGMFQSGTP